MAGKINYENSLNKICNKVIAIVYIFENETTEGYVHYEVWKSDVISAWLNAIYEINGIPYIIDLKTFIFQSSTGSLPHLDFVVNLNNGCTDINLLGLVPSLCAFKAIPCIPCDTTSIIIGENKRISNYIAFVKNMNVPKELIKHDTNGIIKPVSLGSSIGIQKNVGISSQDYKDYINQEFIKGYDITTPIMFNPIIGELEVLPSILYFPKSTDINWFLSNEQKTAFKEYDKITYHLSDTVKKRLLEITKAFNVTTYARIDARVSVTKNLTLEDINELDCTLDNLYFIEINVMPTIKNEINFVNSVEALTVDYPLYNCFKDYRLNKNIKNSTTIGFILSCAILATKAKH